MTENSNPDILILGAVYRELTGLESGLKGGFEAEIGRRRQVAGRLAGIPVRLLTTGPGPVNTVQAVTAAVEHRRPRLLIQTGCAGAFRKSGLDVGDVAVAAEEIDVHLGIEPETETAPMPPLPFPLMIRKGFEIRHRYCLDAKRQFWAASVLDKAFAGACRVRRGPFVTVSTITATDRRAQALYDRYRPCMESMEGAGAAYLALYYDLPLVEIRAASNRVGRRNLNAWNLDLAFERCAEAVAYLVRDIAENGWEPIHREAPGGG